MLYLVVGARPNFVKAAPLVKALKQRGCFNFKIIHTGQHYDYSLSGEFFNLLDLPEPDISLEVGSGSHGIQTARILEEFEKLLIEKPPRAVIVFGDVNSTLACSIASAKLQIPVIHVEAGLRSFDRSMPEEINRLITDSISEFLFVSESSGMVNLAREGIPEHKVSLVGNIMIDSLKEFLPMALRQNVLSHLGLEHNRYALLTMHRPSNVDNPKTFKNLLEIFDDISKKIQIVFPVHPRSRSKMDIFKFSPKGNGKFLCIDSVNYLEALCLQKHAAVVFTDSGGMQEETTFLGIPCITLRPNTERPITVEKGTSTLAGNDPEKIRSLFLDVMNGCYKEGEQIDLWDGRTAERIVDILFDRFL